jgi:hypothetical protein
VALKKTTGQISALFNTGQLCIRYQVNIGVVGVYRGHVSDAWPTVQLGDWVTFDSGDFRAKNIRLLERDPATVLYINFVTKQLERAVRAESDRT